MKMAVLTKTCSRAQARKRNCQFVSSVGNNPSTLITPLGKLRQKNFHKFKVRLDHVVSSKEARI